jgi:hypothetical protein
MSRAYRLRVSESERRVITAGDRVTTCLEILAVVPPEETAELLATELAARGFEQQPDGKWRRTKGSVEITIDAATAEVEVKSTHDQEIELQQDVTGTYYDEHNEQQRDELRKRLEHEVKQQLDKQAQQRAKQLQSQATDDLERELRDLQPELDQLINRVTAAGLKRKAARLGQIKEMSEDAEQGTLTIVVEV